MAFEFGTMSPAMAARKPLTIPHNPYGIASFLSSLGGTPINDVSIKPQALAPVAQVNNQIQGFAPPPANDGGMAALLKAFTAPHGHHFGIGGAEISDTNPYGNPGGDPFKNGFFKQAPTTPGMMFLSGTPHPDATQMAMVQAANQQRTMTPPIGMPAGDPNARAFWGQMGQQFGPGMGVTKQMVPAYKNGYLPF